MSEIQDATVKEEEELSCMQCVDKLYYYRKSKRLIERVQTAKSFSMSHMPSHIVTPEFQAISSLILLQKRRNRETQKATTIYLTLTAPMPVSSLC